MGFDLTFGFFFPQIFSVDFYIVVSFVLRVAKHVKARIIHKLSRKKYKGPSITLGTFRAEGIFNWHLQKERYF